MKILVRIALGLVALVLLAIGLVFVFVDPLARAAVESGGTWATGVETKLGSADVGLTSGTLALEELRVANPPGFEAVPFVTLHSAKCAWDNSSLVTHEIHVAELVIDGLVLDLERNKQGTNFGAILDHLKMRAGEKPEKDAEGQSDRTLVVDRVSLRGIRANLRLSDVPLAAGSLSVEVPPLEIKDFRSDGSTSEIVGQLLSQILKSALDGALKAGGGVFPKDLLGDLETKLQGQVDSAIEDAQKRLEKEAGKALDGLFKKKP